jgi:hypothetical protein
MKVITKKKRDYFGLKINASLRELLLFIVLFGLLTTFTITKTNQYFINSSGKLAASVDFPENKEDEEKGYIIDKLTPKYSIAVATQDFEISLEDIDEKYDGVMNCLGYQDYQKRHFATSFFVVAVTKQLSFECGLPDNRRCLGLYSPETGVIYAPSNMSSLSHELVHHFVNVGHDFPEMSKCGDCLDDLYVPIKNRGRTRNSLNIKQCSKKNIMVITRD